jgi:hypothetical protein
MQKRELIVHILKQAIKRIFNKFHILIKNITVHQHLKIKRNKYFKIITITYYHNIVINNKNHKKQIQKYFQ